MNLEEAQELFEQIVELCYETENPRLIEVAESIYPEVERADDVTKIASSCMEIIVIINEEDFTEDEQEIVEDIEQKIESLSE